MKLYVGIDLHSNNSYIVILNQERETLFKKRLVNDLEVIAEALLSYKEAIEGIVVESTFNWYWLVNGLEEAGYHVHLANPTESSKYCNAKYTDDSSDARNLAELLRDEKLKEGYIYPRKERGLRELLRKRMWLMRHHTAMVLSMQALFTRYIGKKVSIEKIKTMNEKEINDLLNDNNLVLVMQSQKMVLGELCQQIDILEKEIKKQIKTKELFKKLKTVPGIGDVLAMVILIETGDISRFTSAGNYCSYCRCVKSEKISNGKKKGTNNSKSGNKYLGWAFIEAANFAIRYDKQIQRCYQRKLNRTLRVVAIKTIAAKLSKACYFIMKERQEFDIKKSFG